METLVFFFFRIYNREMKRNVVGVQANVLKGFKEYPWPGNVRQPKNIIECTMNFIDEKESLPQEYHIPRKTGDKAVSVQYGGGAYRFTAYDSRPQKKTSPTDMGLDSGRN